MGQEKCLMEKLVFNALQTNLTFLSTTCCVCFLKIFRDSENSTLGEKSVSKAGYNLLFAGSENVQCVTLPWEKQRRCFHRCLFNRNRVYLYPSYYAKL